MSTSVRDVVFRFLGSDLSAGPTMDKLSAKTAKTAEHMKLVGAAMGAAMAGAAVVSVKAAADFQESLTQLVTGAGESDKNLKLVGDGVLSMAGQVGESTKQLTDGLYMVESAGFHGAAGLRVLKAAAEGAKVGAADLGTVANAVTSALNAYRLKGEDATKVTNALVKTVASGKMHMQDLASSLGAVLPAASAAHVGLSDVLGAIATMTAQGTPAADAATYLRQTILQLSNPSAKAALEMRSLGLNAIQVSQSLSREGLAGTLEMLTDAISKKMGPAGTVLIDQLKKTAGSTTDFQKVLADLPPTQQTYVAALAHMVGGTKSMQAALELTGANMPTFKANVAAIGDASAKSGKDVTGWAEVQKDFNQKLAEAKGQVEALEIKIGRALLPTVTTLVHFFSADAVPALADVARWIRQNKEWLEPLVITVGAFLLAWEAVSAVKAIISGVRDAQIALNLAMDANPIGLVVAAVAALAVGFAYAWSHCQTFREILTDVFKVLGDVVLTWVDINVHGLKSVADMMLDTVGVILHGAAAAFGWLPLGVGDNLRKAAGEFDAFHGRVDGVFNAVTGKVEEFRSKLDALGRPHHVPVDVQVNIPSPHIAYQPNSGGNIVDIGRVRAYAAGGGFDMGALALVGEQGPELVRFAHAGTVTPAPQTAAMLNDARGGEPQILIQVSGVVGDETTVAMRILDALKLLKRRGVDVGLA